MKQNLINGKNVIQDKKQLLPWGKDKIKRS